ncbi:sporulation inhibitor of replication protein SirA [Bacillus taeanensis]|uniref:sporulation inhibitor of replication protein SirA n=1 Tax=Bacillus taeanensis TaxID=273032 RepID=UPI0015F060B7|nr:sporulation inhibitor of replication protein SirA [Bacillus taeanensis]
MKRYTIYLIEDEAAKSCFGQEVLLYKLFLKGQADVSPQQTIIKKQISYITRLIPVLTIHSRLQEKLGGLNGYEMKDNHIIFCPDSRAELRIYYDHIVLLANGSLEAETMFFEILRQVESCFFAMNFQNHHFGWLSPIKTKKNGVKFG